MKTQLSPQQIHNLKSVYEFFDNIPENKWCKNMVHDGEKSCAYGHLILMEGQPYGKLTREIQNIFWAELGSGIPEVNNGEGSPKQNILTAIKTILQQDL